MKTRVATQPRKSWITGGVRTSGVALHREPAFRISRSPADRSAPSPAERGQPGGSDPRNRLRLFMMICIALTAVVLVRLWYLQVLEKRNLDEASMQNKLRVTHLEAPRGRVLARDGSVLIDNTASLQVGLDLSQVPKGEEDLVVSRLASVLGLSAEDVKQKIKRPKDVNLSALPISEVDQEAMIRIKENQEDFPGVVPIVRARRVYTQANCEPGIEECPSIAPHVLGYVGETNASDIAEHKDYRMGDTIGRSGLEASYEADLRGQAGERRFIVNNLGRQIGETVSEDVAVQGNDIVTTIDPKVQRAAEDALRDGILAARGRVDRGNTEVPFKATGGAVVVLDPRDGSVRAMASYPNYDPSEFIDGIPVERWTWLNDPVNEYPLSNRAIAGQYAPASTFKVVTAMSGLQHGLITRGTTIDAGPFFVAGKDQRRWRDWKPGGHGATDMRKSLVQSVDVYYYMLGYEMYQRRNEKWFLQETARKIGLGAKTGLDLPSERPGRVPDEDWKRRVNNQNPKVFPDGEWYPGDSVNMSIGQGDMLVTPLQIANVYGAIANGGTVYKPHTVEHVQNQDGTVLRQVPPEQIGSLPIAADLVAKMRDDLVGVTTDGTAQAAFRGFPLDEISVGGKTGTGEVTGKQDTAWFVCFAPADSAEYVVAVVIEQGGHGGQAAAPIARLVLERIYDISSGGISQGSVTD